MLSTSLFLVICHAVTSIGLWHFFSLSSLVIPSSVYLVFCTAVSCLPFKFQLYCWISSSLCFHSLHQSVFTVTEQFFTVWSLNNYLLCVVVHLIFNKAPIKRQDQMQRIPCSRSLPSETLNSPVLFAVPSPPNVHLLLGEASGFRHCSSYNMWRSSNQLIMRFVSETFFMLQESCHGLILSYFLFQSWHTGEHSDKSKLYENRPE